MRLRPVTLLAAAAVALASLVSLPRAEACWDGYAASIGKLSISVATDENPPWDPADIREIALWGSRIDALLPAGTRLDSELGTITFCKTLPGSRRCGASLADVPFSTAPLPALFGQTAILTHASPAAIRRAMTLTVAPLTVQVFASTSAARAHAVAVAVDEPDDTRDRGFIDVGGFPATNPSAHVVDGSDAAGRPIHRVLVGAFLARADAAATEARVRKALGLKGFLRPL